MKAAVPIALTALVALFLASVHESSSGVSLLERYDAAMKALDGDVKLLDPIALSNLVDELSAAKLDAEAMRLNAKIKERGATIPIKPPPQPGGGDGGWALLMRYDAAMKALDGNAALLDPIALSQLVDELRAAKLDGEAMRLDATIKERGAIAPAGGGVVVPVRPGAGPLRGGGFVNPPRPSDVKLGDVFQKRGPVFRPPEPVFKPGK
jgi:hypothetical protein